MDPVSGSPATEPGTIHVIGVGPDGVAPSGQRHLRDVTLVVGGGRHLATAGMEGIPLHDLDATLAAIGRADGDVAVLASGDPGFFGIVRVLAERFGRDRLEVHPAVSSVAAAFAAMRLPWDDALVVSAHGRDPATAVAACLAHPKVAVLTGPGFGPAELARALLDEDATRTVLVAERLGEDDARVVEGDLDHVVAESWRDPNVAVVVDGSGVAPRSTVHPPRTTPTRWALPTGAFDHRRSMITKPEVRAVALAGLGPGPGDLLWDVGAGSGAVAVECARFGAAVIAVERSAEACRLVTENARRHGVQVRVVHGAAPEALADLPDPDAVFVGGGGGDLPPILDVAATRARRAVVVTLATVERLAPTLDAFDGWEVTAQQVQTAVVTVLGTGHRLDAHNPVFVVQAVRG